MATLFIFSGLPGTGKTTLSQQLATALKATYLRIDTVEQGLRDLCNYSVSSEGYRLAYRIAIDNLKLDINVVTDSCNSIELSRKEWEKVAMDSGANFINVEIICSCETEHRQRIETRISNISNLRLPTWPDVKNREYHPWSKERIVIDTANKSIDDCFRDLISKISKEEAFYHK
ncbi:MAG: AAA family ATPase [Limnothrix sp.]